MVPQISTYCARIPKSLSPLRHAKSNTNLNKVSNLTKNKQIRVNLQKPSRYTIPNASDMKNFKATYLNVMRENQEQLSQQDKSPSIRSKSKSKNLFKKAKSIKDPSQETFVYNKNKDQHKDRTNIILMERPKSKYSQSSQVRKTRKAIKHQTLTVDHDYFTEQHSNRSKVSTEAHKNMIDPSNEYLLTIQSHQLESIRNKNLFSSQSGKHFINNLRQNIASEGDKARANLKYTKPKQLNINLPYRNQLSLDPILEHKASRMIKIPKVQSIQVNEIQGTFKNNKRVSPPPRTDVLSSFSQLVLNSLSPTKFMTKMDIESSLKSSADLS